MSTTGEGDAAATLSYEGGGAGGKFRKRSFRRTQQTTPYDRPVNILRGVTDTTTAVSNDNNGGWLAKLVVDPASKLISYGANRFFSSVFLNRLPAPPRQAPGYASPSMHILIGKYIYLSVNLLALLVTFIWWGYITLSFILNICIVHEYIRMEVFDL